MVLEYLMYVLLLSTHIDLQSEYQEFKAKTLNKESRAAIGEFYFTARRQSEQGVDLKAFIK